MRDLERAPLRLLLAVPVPRPSVLSAAASRSSESAWCAFFAATSAVAEKGKEELHEVSEPLVANCVGVDELGQSESAA
jgi:hypothetical protein